MKLPGGFDYPTGAKEADRLAGAGKIHEAARLWQALCVWLPYDRRPREKLGHLLFDASQAAYPLGSVARSRFILRTIVNSLPTETLTDEYFLNLEHLLKGQVTRAAAGDVALGVGAGRCGSTTLAAAVAATPEVCATHENPPSVYWEPLEEQVQFHWRRFRILADYYGLVFDASHWWLNVLERFLAEFPRGKVVALKRDTEPCVESFLRIKGTGAKSPNHWAQPDSRYWSTSLGDPLYPNYPVPAEFASDLDAAKAAMIRRYVSEYHQSIDRLSDSYPDKTLLVRTETLNDPATAARLNAFLGRSVSIPDRALNAGGTADSDQERFQF